MSGRKKSSAATTENDAVDQLLQAAQDEMLLELSVDSHMSRVAPDYLNPDLRRRFQALRSRPSSSHSQQKKQSSAPPPSPPKPQPEQKEDEEKKDRKSKVVVPDNVDEELKAVLGDDLSARFAALKASLSSSSSNPTAATSISTNEGRIGLEKSDGEDDEEDEVERVIQWAKDAARLDPSPASDEDDDDLIGSDSDDKDTEYDDDPKHKKKESKLTHRMVVYAFKKQGMTLNFWHSL
ncbi:hypothetical protein E1A91_D02G224100v1 [Gossypium mustelinum]|uniref:46 kDa FK506-binding nuclear protein n=1 Tax=Gossypium mustelinum TaxID=34275 RepID=A0A5D2VYT6_GOSMU|nr:hypothetical protein E1A91_D02G224100v1 [Gossypium mustelinum]